MTPVAPRRTLRLQVDGTTVSVEEGASLLDACDAAGRYVPRLCYHPGLGCGAVDAAPGLAAGAGECGLCVVRVDDGPVMLACGTLAGPDAKVCTDDESLRVLRLERLGTILAGHPHICLSCPDRDGCTREECTYGNPPEARCCDQLGRCELERLVGWLDPAGQVARRSVGVDRAATSEGRIRLEMGLCIGCTRCVRICAVAPEAGTALEVDAGGAARPRNGTLRASGCTFCGLCVMVCPAGALTAPGEAGARWLAGRR